MILTGNPPFGSWTEVPGSEPRTSETLVPLTHRRRIIETKGESYRLRGTTTRARSRTNTGALASTGALQADWRPTAVLPLSMIARSYWVIDHTWFSQVEGFRV